MTKTRDGRIDAYITKSAPFARPILKKLRSLVHKGCPRVQETMKWSFPHFEYKGILCSMAAFKEHCVFGFWKARLMKDPAGLFSSARESAMGQFGRIRSMADLPSDSLMIRYIQEAARLNDTGKRLSVTRKPQKKPLRVPPYLREALKRHAKALAAFEAFSPSHRREYVEWLAEARSPETRAHRLKTAIKWMAQGKPRNWKYMKKR